MFKKVIAAFFTVIAFSVSAGTTEDIDGYCNALAKNAASVLTARYNGMSKAQIVGIINNTIADSDRLKPIFMSIADAGYSYPITGNRKEDVDDFSRKTLVICIRAVPVGKYSS